MRGAEIGEFLPEGALQVSAEFFSFTTEPTDLLPGEFEIGPDRRGDRIQMGRAQLRRDTPAIGQRLQCRRRVLGNLHHAVNLGRAGQGDGVPRVEQLKPDQRMQPAQLELPGPHERLHALRPQCP